MSQLSYSQNMPTAFAGMLADMGEREVLSYKAEEAIPFGRGLARSANTAARGARLPLLNQIDLVFSADLVSSNSVAGTVNGTALTATVYATSHAATMAAIATKIEAIDGVASATVGGANDRTITVLAEDGTAISASGFVVTLGASQATVTQTNTTTDVFQGVSGAKANVEQAADGTVQYAQEDAVNVVTKGRVYVLVDQTVTPTDTPYVRYTAGAGNSVRGSFRKDADTDKAVVASRCRFLEGATAGGFALLEVNLP